MSATTAAHNIPKTNWKTLKTSTNVAPGEETPAGECPDCGALCHPIDAEPTPNQEPRGASVSIQVDAQQRATLLAALRFYQMNDQGDPAQRRDDIHEIATANDAVISLDNAGIRSLFRLITKA